MNPSANQTTTGFMDALCNHIVGLSVGFTKGENLFVENMVDDPDRISDQVVLYDDGYEQLVGLQHVHVNWNVGVATRSLETGLAAVEQLRPVIAALIANRNFRSVSDNAERFKVIAVRVISSPQVIERLDSGAYLARAVVQFQVIPD